MDVNDKILITGASGVLGVALVTALKSSGYNNLILLNSSKCDLTNLNETVSVFKKFEPKYVFHLAGYVHGIMGNLKNKATSYFKNIYINTNTIQACIDSGTRKIIAMGTVAAYPHFADKTTYTEDMIWNGYPHHSEDSYAMAKRSMLAQLIAYKESYDLDYAYVLSTNLYGPHDKFDIEHGHVIPSLVSKFYEAKITGKRVSVWGNGQAERDFLYSEDAANALLKIARTYSGPINLATGQVTRIRDAVTLLSEISGVGLDRVDWDETKPNGQMARQYDISKLTSLGIKIESSFRQGLLETFDWYSRNANTARK